MFRQNVLLMLVGFLSVAMGTEDENHHVNNDHYMLPARANNDTLQSRVDQFKVMFGQIASQLNLTVDPLDATVDALRQLNTSDGDFQLFKAFFDAQIETLAPQLVQALSQPDLLDKQDLDSLKTFQGIDIAEPNILIFCHPSFLKQYIQESKSKTHTFGELICAGNLLLRELVTKLNVVSPDLGMKAFNTMHNAYIEMATDVYSTGKVSGAHLALPILVTEKLLAASGNQKVANKSITMKNGEECNILKMLNEKGMQPEEAFGVVFDVLFKYLEKLPHEKFCSIKKKWSEIRTPGSFVHSYLVKSNRPCYFQPQSEKKNQLTNKRIGRMLRRALKGNKGN